MRLIWEGKDITESVGITGCVYTDSSGGKLDVLEIEMMNAARWYGWGPKRDDTVEITEGNFSTGKMYLDIVQPRENTFRIVALSAPNAVHRKAWKSWENASLETILRYCSAECGMEWGLYGVNKDTLFPYIMRRNEKAIGFLNRIAELEGAVLKCVNGRMVMIGVKYAQGLTAIQRVEVSADMPGRRHNKTDGKRLSSMTVQYDRGEATSYDSAATGGLAADADDAPAASLDQAVRWSSGLLLMCNRQAETLQYESGFNPGLFAMTRVDLTGSQATSGEWLVDEVKHDLFHKKSNVKLVRCIDSII